MKPHYQQAATTETLLYGCKIDQPDYMEEILYQCKGYTNKEELLNKGKQWADQNGYNRLRIKEINLSQKPNFIEAINI
jgi:hypothetical protein